MEKITHDGVTYYYEDKQSADEAWGRANRAMPTEDNLHILAQTAIFVTSSVVIQKPIGFIDHILEAAYEKFSNGGV